MKKKYNPIQLNASGLAHHNIKIDSNYYKKKLYSTNKYLNQSYLNNTSYKNHDSFNISVSLPMSELKSKLLSPKIFRNPTETSVSSSNSRTRITAIKNYNNISIYYSKHKNKRKEKNSKSNLKSGMKYSSKNKENICNNYQNNSKIKIRKIMQIKMQIQIHHLTLVLSIKEKKYIKIQKINMKTQKIIIVVLKEIKSLILYGKEIIQILYIVALAGKIRMIEKKVLNLKTIGKFIMNFIKKDFHIFFLLKNHY
jgi:hypothetical protein